LGVGPLLAELSRPYDGGKPTRNGHRAELKADVQRSVERVN